MRIVGVGWGVLLTGGGGALAGRVFGGRVVERLGGEALWFGRGGGGGARLGIVVVIIVVVWGGEKVEGGLLAAKENELNKSRAVSQN